MIKNRNNPVTGTAGIEYMLPPKLPWVSLRVHSIICSGITANKIKLWYKVTKEN